MTKKSWQEKRDSKKMSKKILMEKDFAGIKARELMLVSTPLDVDKAIRNIRKGKSLTIPNFRNRLAKQYHCDKACPVSTSIFIRICAEAALDEWRSGIGLSEITPFWRLIDSDSKIAKKLNIDNDFILNQRNAEGLN